MSVLEHSYQIVILPKNHNHNYGGKTVLIKDDKERSLKKIDILPKVPYVTFLRFFPSYRRAIKWASKRGTVLSCRKVSPSYYLDSIAYKCRDIVDRPIELEIKREEYTITKDLEIELLTPH